MRAVHVRRHLAALLIAVAVGPALRAQSAADADLADLRREVLARFEVMPLREGIALVGRTADRRVEIVDGLVLDRGTPLSGAELRSRLGTDSRLALRLSYLDNDRLRALFAPPPSPPAAVPAPPVPPAPAPEREAPRIDSAPAPPAPAEPDERRTYRRTGARLAFGKSISVEEDEEVADGVVAVGGRIRIAGRVRDEVVAVGGSVELLPTADVRGDITAVGGQVTIAPGARHSGAVHHVDFRQWRGWGWPVVGWSWFDAGGAGRWLPLAGTVTRVGLLALAVATVMLLAGRRVDRIGDAATAAPLRAGVIGLTLQLLFVPVLVIVSLGLAITIIGLPFVALVIPLALATMFLAMLLGFTSVARALGDRAARRLGWDAPAAIGVAVLGVALVVLPTVASRLVGVAPEALRAIALTLLVVGSLVEYVAWTVGLGAAAMTGLGRWATAPPPIPPPYDGPLDRPAPI